VNYYIRDGKKEQKFYVDILTVFLLHSKKFVSFPYVGSNIKQSPASSEQGFGLCSKPEYTAVCKLPGQARRIDFIFLRKFFYLFTDFS